MNKTTLKKLNEVSSPCLSHKQQNMCEKEILEQELLGAKKKLTIIKHQVMTSWLNKFMKLFLIGTHSMQS